MAASNWDQLIRSLQDPDKRAIRQAVDALIAIGQKEPGLAERLERLLEDSPKEKRWPVAYALAYIAPPSPSCLEVLVESLDIHDPDIRWAILLLLVRLGKKDRGVVDRLLDLLKSGTPTQRRMAVYCLRDMGLKDGASLKALEGTLSDPNPLVRVAGASSLKTRSDVDKDGLNGLLRLFLNDPDSGVRRTAAVTLALLGAPTEEIRKALEEAAQAGDPGLKKAAAAALEILKKRPA